MRFKALIISILLAGCQTVVPFHGPDGATHYLITCNGLDKTKADCYNAAFESCGGQYCVESYEEIATFAINEHGSARPLIFRSMEFQCGVCRCTLPGGICIIGD